MFDIDISFSPPSRVAKKRALRKARHEALHAIESATLDGSITMAEAKILKRHVALSYMNEKLLIDLVRPIEEVSLRTEELGHEISHALHQARK
jgi:hypothetical protein